MAQIGVRHLRASDYQVWRTMWRESVAHESAILTDDAIDSGWRAMMSCKAKISDNDTSVTQGDLGESSSVVGDVVGLVSGLAACTSDGEMIGFLHYVVHPVMGSVRPVCYLQDMYVRPENRSQGAGKKMINELKKISEQSDWERIYWLVKDGDEEAEGFYEGQSVVVPFKVHVHPTRFLKDDKRTA